ncbi:hypothetical protein [Vallitalea okinawensis]|uniref:hypothetical protein n=1 Tax=Vallitalea okinawensis TaxID=2078660 RepID=UPI000CFD9CCD|nr:hypothetical protein [Vallitalea okinawensis]
MNELLKKIITIEEKAQQIIESARDEEKNIDNNLKSEISHLESNILDKQQHKVDQLKEFEFDFVQKEVDKIKAETTEKLKEMDEQAKEKIEPWADQLVELVLRR